MARRRITAAGSYRIHSLEFGAAEQALVLLHGLSGSSRWWRRNVPGLAARYRVILPDLIGFGRTHCPGPLPDIDVLARVLAEWMDAIGLESTHLMGHSMGGQTAIHLAARFPERIRRLILVDAAGIPRSWAPVRVARFAAEIVPPRRWGDPLFLPVILRDAWTAGPRSILQAIQHIVQDDVRPLLPDIQAPTLVVWGEEDGLVPLADGEELRKRIPGARLAVLRGAAHNPMVDRPSEFNRLVLRFLEGEPVGR